MNIFVLSSDAVESARMMCDKHVVKMIVETCQLLSTAHHVVDGTPVQIVGKRTYNTYQCDKSDICKATMINHPCSIWTRENSANYKWLWHHGAALCGEYNHRYNKVHSMKSMLTGPLFDVPSKIKKSRHITDFVQAMPDAYKHANAIVAYRKYYINDKIRFAKWKCGNVPKWFANKNAELENELIPF